jgi:S1-C subfamily serine protease
MVAAPHPRQGSRGGAPRLSPPRRIAGSLLAILLIAIGVESPAAGLPDTLASIKPGVVAVGTFMAVRAQRHQLRGSGFAVSGSHVVTNAHVVAGQLDADRRETFAVFLPKGGDQAEVRTATLVRKDPAHDLALLKVSGAALRPLRLAKSSDAREGATVAFTGFPILGALGLFPATHRGIVSAIAPVVIPVGSGRDLKPEVIRRLNKPFDIFQLDITAFPGNSGSPLYDPDSGRVLGVINSVFVKGTKEVALSDPSGITYAIPVDHVRALLQQAGVKF